MQYLTGIAGRERDIVVAKPSISDMKKFLSSIDLQPSNTLADVLCNRHNLEELYDKMKKVYGYQAYKLRRLWHAIRYLINKSDDDQITSSVYERFNRLITLWIKSLSKARSTQQNEHSVKMDAEVDSVEDPYSFLDSVAILGLGLG